VRTDKYGTSYIEREQGCSVGNNNLLDYWSVSSHALVNERPHSRRAAEAPDRGGGEISD
jgi:hypothetical protein